MKTLAEIALELRLIAGELRGYEDVPQWLQIQDLAIELNDERAWILQHCNELAKRVVEQNGFPAQLP